MDLLDTQIYGRVGDDGFTQLCAAFFSKVPADDILGPMYKHDLAGAERRLRSFLIGRFGGPDLYVRERGHPRLRVRHARFTINQVARDRWVALMDHRTLRGPIHNRRR